MSFESPVGQKYESLYFRVNEYTCDRNEKTRARVRGCMNRQLTKEGASWIEDSDRIIETPFDYTDEAVNSKKQICEHLKSLEEFATTINVLE